MRCRELILLLLGGGMTAARAPRAQQKAMPVIGYLGSATPGANALLLPAFQEGLSETSYVEGQNVAVEYRWAEGRFDRLPALAADLAGRKVDVIVSTGGITAALAAKNASSTIPIVFITGDDPVERGLVANLARPGGNLTGFSLMLIELMPKRLELLSELVPRAKAIALLVNPKNAGAERVMRDVAEAAREGGAAPYPEGRRPKRDRRRFRDACPTAGRRARRQHRSLFFSQRNQLMELAARYAIPAIYERREFAAAGGLVSYGPSFTDTWRRVGIYAGNILNGAKPADLPVQQPTTFELVVNLKTAKALGLSIPQSILARADEIIE